jgi:hypothetical protein
LLTAADLVTLPKGQAFALIDGGQLWKVRMPLPDIADDQSLPEDVESIVEAMMQQYRFPAVLIPGNAIPASVNG